MVTMTITKKLMVIVTGAKIGLQSSARMAGEKLYCPLGLTSNHCNLKMCWCWRSFYKPVQPPKVGDITLITMVIVHYLKDILSSSDRDAIGNGFAETYNPYKVEDSALHFIFLSLWIIPLLFRILAKKGSGTGFLGFQLMEPRVPHSNKYMFFVLWNLESNIFSRIICGYDLKCAQCLCVSSVRSLGRSQLFWLDADKKWRRMTEQIFAQDTKGRRRGRQILIKDAE